MSKQNFKTTHFGKKKDLVFWSILLSLKKSLNLFKLDLTYALDLLVNKLTSLPYYIYRS